MKWGSGSIVQTKFLKLCYFYCINCWYPKSQNSLLPTIRTLVLCIPALVLLLTWTRKGPDSPLGSILIQNVQYYYTNLNCHFQDPYFHFSLDEKDLFVLENLVTLTSVTP